MIPPHQDNVAVAASRTIAQDTRLLSFMPHMHLRGKSFEYKVTVSLRPSEVLLSVPAYDFGWQTYYVLDQPLAMPKGTKIDCRAHYDNSAGNPDNPDPEQGRLLGRPDVPGDDSGYIDSTWPDDEPAGVQVPAVKPALAPSPLRRLLPARAGCSSR